MKIEEAEQLARELRAMGHPKADELDAALAKARAAQADGVDVSVNVRYKLEKFHGEYRPGMRPFEVIEGEG